MEIFTNSYDIDTKINKMLKNMNKKYLSKKRTNEDKNIDIITLKNIIEEIADNHITNLDMYINVYYHINDLLELASEDNIYLLDIFNMNKLIKKLESVMTDEQIELFTNNDSFRREILFISLYKIIEEAGYNGGEYGLIFAKAFNFDISIPMTYASYDSNINNPRLKEFVEKYLELGGEYENVYWLPNYFEKNSKNRYAIEKLKFVIQSLNINQDVKTYNKKLPK